MKPSIAAVLGLLIIIGAAALIAPLVSAKTPVTASNAAAAEAPGKAKAPDKAPSPEEECAGAKASLSAAFAVDAEAIKAKIEAANDAIRKDEGSPEQKALVEATVRLQKATADFQRAAAVFAQTEEEMRKASTGGRASDGQIAAYIAAQDAAREALKPAQAAEQARAKVAKAYPKLGELEQAQRELQALAFRREQAATSVRRACGIGTPPPAEAEAPASPTGEAP